MTPYDSTQWGLPLLTHSVVYQFASQFTTSSQKFQHWELQRCYSSGMAITSDEARRLFGKFIGFNKMLSEQQDVNNYYGFAYRMDTWQLWADCEDEHLPSSRMLCAHGGLHITIIDSAKHIIAFILKGIGGNRYEIINETIKIIRKIDSDLG